MQRKKRNWSCNIQWWRWSMVYHHNGFVPTHARGYMMYSYALLVPMNQSVLRKPSKEHIISGPELSAIHRVLKSHSSKMSIIYTCNHEKRCVTVHHVPVCMSCHKTIVAIMGSAHCFHDYMYMLWPFCEIWALLMSWIIYNYLYIYIYR